MKLGMTDEQMGSMFALNMMLLPAHANMPSWADCLKIMNYYTVSTMELAVRYDVCVNSCVIYQPGDPLLPEGVRHCPSCGEGRYVNNASMVARKHFYWFQPIKQLRNRFINPQVALRMKLQKVQAPDSQWRVSGIQSSPLWKEKVLDSGFAEVGQICYIFVK